MKKEIKGEQGMVDISFEKMKLEYIPDVLDIYTYYILNSTATFHEKPLSIDEMKELVIFEDSRYEAYAIFEEKVICGYVILTQYKKREAYRFTGEVTIYLRNDCIGKGVGSQSIGFIENIARQKGFHSLVAIICGENEKSIGLFERNGYIKRSHLKEVGMKFGRWLDVVDYQKIL
jgi:Sortase and related acyltransferases